MQTQDLRQENSKAIFNKTVNCNIQIACFIRIFYLESELLS